MAVVRSSYGYRSIDSDGCLSFAAPMAIVQLTPVAINSSGCRSGGSRQWLSCDQLPWLSFRVTPVAPVVRLTPAVAVVPVAPVDVVGSTGGCCSCALVAVGPVARPVLSIDSSNVVPVARVAVV